MSFTRQVKDRLTKVDTFGVTNQDFEFETRATSHMIQLNFDNFGTNIVMKLQHSIDEGVTFNDVPSADNIEITQANYSSKLLNLYSLFNYRYIKTSLYFTFRWNT